MEQGDISIQTLPNPSFKKKYNIYWNQDIL